MEASLSVQDKIAELEREVARKKALVNAKITLPKDTPEDVKAEVNAAITEALLKIASNDELSSSGVFTDEEIKVLKLLANRAQGKAPTTLVVKAAPSNTTNVVKVEKALGKIDKNPTPEAGSRKGLEAEVIDLEGVPVAQRGKIGSMEKCLVVEEREDGLLHVLTRGGVRFNVSPEFLNFDISSNN